MNVNGFYKEIEDIRNLLIKGHEQDQIRLSDVARVTKGYVKPEREGLLYDTLPGDSDFDCYGGRREYPSTGKEGRCQIGRVERRYYSGGIDFQKVFFQPARVKVPFNVFMVNLIESVVIVILVVMLFHGFRSGYIKGPVS